jgi:hypothetical protein
MLLPMLQSLSMFTLIIASSLGIACLPDIPNQSDYQIELILPSEETATGNCLLARAFYGMALVQVLNESRNQIGSQDTRPRNWTAARFRDVIDRAAVWTTLAYLTKPCLDQNEFEAGMQDLMRQLQRFNNRIPSPVPPDSFTFMTP